MASASNRPSGAPGKAARVSGEPIVRFTAKDLRNPADSADQFIANVDAVDCYGEICGQYHEENGEAIKPNPHSHLVVTGHAPDTTPRHYPISK